MPDKADVKELVEQMPELGGGDGKKSRDTGKLTGPTRTEARKVYDRILAGGADSIVAVIDLLVAVDDGKDYKARYVLHGLVTYVCGPGKGKQRATVIEAIASQVGGRRPKAIQGFLIAQLQLCADGRVATKLGGCLTDDDLCEPAVRALQAVGKGACEQLLAALPTVKGTSRLYVVQGLSAVGGAAAVEAIRGALAEGDDEVRLAAAWGLATLGDAKSTDALLALADAKGSTWRRDQATQACLQLAENLRGAGETRTSARIYKHLRDTRSREDERYIRQAAEQALADA